MDSEILASRIESQLQPKTPPQGGEHPPSRVPDHELIAPIGRGSYGEVWLARSVTGVLHAVKVVWRHNFSSDRPYDREFRGIVQFEPISRSHPGVVSVLHVGRDEPAGCFYYVMELADPAGSGGSVQASETGNQLDTAKASDTRPVANYKPRTLASDLRARGRMPAADVVGLGIQLANALGHLHRHGLVHRDVKPSNVIFVEGHAQLADIGLVAGRDEARSFVGTEGFIPPEGPGTERADLFSLGRLLYEAATGKDRCEFPMLPGDLDRWPAQERETLLELNEVLARACAAKPSERQTNAAELASDLNMILAGRSVRRAYGLERRLRQAKRISVAAGAVLLLTTSLVWFQREQQHRAEERANHEASLRNRAEAAEHETQEQLYTALLEQARATVLTGELGQRIRALDAVRRAGSISNSAALRGVAIAALALPDLRFEQALPYGSEFTLRLVDPAFERIALCRGRGPVEIRSLADQRLLARLPASTNLPSYLAEWSTDGRLLAVKRDYDGRGIRSDKEVWDVNAGQRLLLLRAAPYDAMSFDPSSPRLLVGRDSGASLWDLEQAVELSRLELDDTPRWLRLSPDGERLAASYTGGRKRLVSIYRIKTGELLASNVFDRAVASFNWHPSGRWLAVADYGGGIHWMDAQSGKEELLGRHKAEATRVEFSPDGDYFISGGWDRELICWNSQSLKRAFGVWLDGYVGHFRADGRAYALDTETGVQLHAFERSNVHRVFSDNLGSLVRYAAFSPDSRWLAASGTAGIEVWDLQSDAPGTLAAEGWLGRPSFAANGDLFAGRPGGCFGWHVSPGAGETAPPKLVPIDLTLPEQFGSLSTISNDVVLTSMAGTSVVSPAGLDNSVHDWRRTASGWNSVSPDGKWLGVFPPNKPYVFLHRLPNLDRVTVLTNDSPVRSVHFSPSGDELAVACRSDVEFWSTATWHRTRIVTNLNNQVYSANGRTMWLTQQYHVGGLYDSRTLELLMPLPLGTFPLAVSPDGRRLAVSVNLKQLEVWDLHQVRNRLRELGLDWEEKERLKPL